MQFVHDGSWTIEKLIEMTEGVYVDQDYSSEKTSDDLYGLVIRYFGWNTFFIGSEMTILERDENNYLTLSEDYKASSLKLADLLDRLSIYNDSDDCFSVGIDTGGIEPEMFRNRLALFAQIQLRLAYYKICGQTEFEYGVLPNPKYDTNQKEYITWGGYDAT